MAAHVHAPRSVADLDERRTGSEHHRLAGPDLAEIAARSAQLRSPC
jgi:hypothetical protein